MAEPRSHGVRPGGGLAPILLLAVMLLGLGGAVENAGWLADAPFVAPLLLGGAAFSLLFSGPRRHCTAALLRGALAGAAVSLGVAALYLDGPPAARLAAMGPELWRWLAALARGAMPSEISPFVLVIGIAAWSTGFTAAHGLLRHRRSPGAIGLVGTWLVVTLATASGDLLGYLVLCAAASLLLRVVSEVDDRADRVDRRGVVVQPTAQVASLRAGTVLTLAVVGVAWLFALVLIGAPLKGALPRVPQLLPGMPGAGAAAGFGDHLAVADKWSTDESPVMQVSVAAAPWQAFLLKTATYDSYTGDGWARSNPSSRSVPANGRLFSATSPELPSEGADRRLIRMVVEADRSLGHDLYAPGVPMAVDIPSSIVEPWGLPLLGGLAATSAVNASDRYVVTSVVTAPSDPDLANAGDAYPDAIQRYRNLDNVSSAVQDRAREIVRDAGRDPIARARALQAYLTNGAFSYTPSPAARPAGTDVVSFFLFQSRSGFCEQFASAMVALARSVGLPARLAVGYAHPQQIGPALYRYTNADAHAWAEIYFPGYGWQPFDATPGGAGLSTLQPASETTPPGPPRARPSGLGRQRGQAEDPASGATSVPAPIGPANPFPWLPIGLGGMAVAAAALVLHRRRRRNRLARGQADGEWQWRQLLGAARAAGMGPRVSDTVYEYAGWLEEQIPDRHVEIDTLANLTVRRLYSGRASWPESSAQAPLAWGRLRARLIRARVRRVFRRPVPGRHR